MHERDVTGLLDEIAGIGRDPVSGGYRRFAFTREDADLGEWFVAACTARGLDVTTDVCGNQWAWWGDPDAGPGVVTGSHLDSVPDGGAFDGPLGVATALVAVDRLQAAGFRPSRPLGLVRFVDEEGGRFGLACSGSRLVTGAVAPARVLGLADADGTTYAEAMRAAGLDADRAGADPALSRRVGAFVELHVEQGRGLSTPAVDAAVGVATMIRPHGRWRVELHGRADHAGTTRLADREDPMLELARFVQFVRQSARVRDALATVGKVAVTPNAVNAIPSKVVAWLDVRADTQRQVREVIGDVAFRGFDAVEESWTAATAMDVDLTERVGRVAGAAAGLPGSAPALPTGAGHDAGVLAQAGVPVAMLFVRNPTGISHAPAEHADAADCEAGALALAAVLADLCSADPQPQRQT